MRPEHALNGVVGGWSARLLVWIIGLQQAEAAYHAVLVTGVSELDPEEWSKPDIE